MNYENGRAHAYQTQSREVVGQSGYDGLLPGPIERLHLDGRIARIGSPGIAEIGTSVGVRVTERQYPTAVARLALDSYLIRAEPSLEKIRPRAVLVRELVREKGAKLPCYRKAVAGLGVENIDDVLRIIVEGAEGELALTNYYIRPCSDYFTTSIRFTSIGGSKNLDHIRRYPC